MVGADGRYRRRRAGRVRLGGLLLLLMLAAGVYLGATFGPHFWVYLEMKQITKSVALHWARENQRKAQGRLGEELRRHEIPDYILADDCSLDGRRGGRKVSCDWVVDIFYPGTTYYKTIEFRTFVEVDGEGRVVAELYRPF